MAVDRYTKPVQLRDGGGHQTLAARLVDRSGPWLEYGDGQPGAIGVQRGRESDRPTTGD